MKGDKEFIEEYYRLCLKYSKSIVEGGVEVGGAPDGMCVMNDTPGEILKCVTYIARNTYWPEDISELDLT